MNNQQSCLELAHNEQTTEYDYSTQSISTYTDSNCTPFPSMTKSQRVKLNEILHREPIGYASTFETIEIAEPVEQIEEEQIEQVEEHILFENESNFVCQKQNENNSCCIIM